jgi:hypothetical protein
LKEACMSNFSFLGSFSGTSPDGRAGGRVLEETKLKLTQPSLAGTGAELGNTLNCGQIKATSSCFLQIPSIILLIKHSFSKLNMS